MPPPSPRRRAPAAPTNLVTAGAPLVGRVRDGAALADLFEEGARLVSVIGPGGVGKTTLATAYAAGQIDGYGGHGGGGVWFCDLTDVQTPTDFCASVAGALGLRLDAAED